MKIRITQLTRKQRIETLDTLYTATGSLRDREAMKLFLRDLLTESERVMLGRRIMIARRLLSGATTRDIATELGVGLDTVWRVEKWLTDQVPGYEEALKGMEKEFKRRRTRAERAADFARIKRKYPLHFLLFPWPKGYPKHRK